MGEKRKTKRLLLLLLSTKLKQKKNIQNEKNNLQSPVSKSSSPMRSRSMPSLSLMASKKIQNNNMIRKEDACCCDKAASQFEKSKRLELIVRQNGTIHEIRETHHVFFK